MNFLPLLFAWDAGWFSIALGMLILGGVLGFFGSRALFKKTLRDNPPINEDAIRAMFRSMGRKPSEAQVRQVMNSMKKHTNI